MYIRPLSHMSATAGFLFRPRLKRLNLFPVHLSHTVGLLREEITQRAVAAHDFELLAALTNRAAGSREVSVPGDSNAQSQ